MATRAPNLPDRGRKPQIQHHAKHLGTSAESMRRLLGGVTLTASVPFTRDLEEENSDRSVIRACN